MKVFSIYDSKAMAYTRPFFVQTHGLARRMFADLANDTQHEVGRHPGDYTLFYIGNWDDQTGFITQDNAHENLGVATEFLGDSHTQQEIPMRAIT